MRCAPTLLFPVCLLAAASLRAEETSADPAGNSIGRENRTPFVPTEQYQTREIEGFQVRVNRELNEGRVEVGKAALALLETKLGEIRERVPAKVWTMFKTVPFWVGVDDYQAPNAVYHPSADWLRDHGFNPDKARSIEIPNAAVFLDWSRNQPMMVLHELAHAYHHQVLGHDCAELRQRFQEVSAAGLYDRVTDGFTGKPRRAYALNNVEEFFSEMSEAFFGRNDMSPFTREELRAHDPVTCELIERLWNR